MKLPTEDTFRDIFVISTHLEKLTIFCLCTCKIMFGRAYLNLFYKHTKRLKEYKNNMSAYLHMLVRIDTIATVFEYINSKKHP